MFLNVTTLSWWKTDHTEASNEDAYLASPADGIFVVADGVSTLFFSKLWATILTQYFYENPLTSDNPFEVEWWLRPAQERFKAQAPDIKGFYGNVQQKARSGSASTLASVCITSIDAATDMLHAELLAFGDSCIFIGNETTQKVRLSFPVQNARDFEKAPICIPSLLSKFNRNFHQCQIQQDVILQANDILLIATDTVSKWILSSGVGTRSDVWHAFKEVADKTPNNWKDFINGCRHARQMVDDDVTALVVKIHAEQLENDVAPGTTPAHNNTTIQQRTQQLQEAIQRNDKEAIAIFYGDGKDVTRSGVLLPDDVVSQAQNVANALLEVWLSFRGSINSPQFPKRVEESWQKHSSLLKDEPCAQTLIEALQASGVNIQPQEMDIAAEKTRPIEPQKPATPDIPDNSPPSAVSGQIEQPKSSNQEKEMTASLISIITKACEGRDDKNILYIYEHLPKGLSLPENIQLCVQQAQNRVNALEQQAQNRVNALKQLQQLFHYATASDMVQEYERQAKILQDVELPQRTREQLALAHQLVDAERRQSDTDALSALNAIRESAYLQHFDINKERRLYDKIRRNQYADEFRNILHTPGLTVEKLWKAGKDAEERNVLSLLNTEERNKVVLAEQFQQAFAHNNPSLIVISRIAYKYSYPNLFTFTAQEEQQIQEAMRNEGKVDKPVSPVSPVILLEDSSISFTDFKNAYVVRVLWDTYVVGQQGERPYEQHSVEDYLKFVFELLINDKIIVDGIEEQRNFMQTHERQRFSKEFKPFEQELRQTTDSYYKNFTNHSSKPSGKLLKEFQISQHDVQEVFSIWSRRACFSKYLQGMWGKSPIEKWLPDRRHGKKCIYPEWAAEARESTNTDRSKSWVYKWNGWKDIGR